MAKEPGNQLAFLKFYGSDFLNSTAGWSMEERGLYVTLLWYAWVNDGLPREVDRIDRMAPGAKTCWEALESKFPESPDGKRRNPRQERDRESMLQQWEAMSRRGAQGAAKRWNRDAPAMPQAMPDAMLQASPKQCSSNGIQIQNQIQIQRDIDTSIIVADDPVYRLDNTQAIQASRPTVMVHASIGRARRFPVASADLERIWARFPRKVGKLKAMRLIEQAIRRLMDDWDHEKPDDAVIFLIERIDALAKKHKTGDPKFIPHPATWLNQGRYLDPEETTR
jgi:uncharacterized protein YdaU (DUF1376 family)